jgi:hypothetical protein
VPRRSRSGGSSSQRAIVALLVLIAALVWVAYYVGAFGSGAHKPSATDIAAAERAHDLEEAQIRESQPRGDPGVRPPIRKPGAG